MLCNADLANIRQGHQSLSVNRTVKIPSAQIDCVGMGPALEEVLSLHMIISHSHRIRPDRCPIEVENTIVPRYKGSRCPRTPCKPCKPMPACMTSHRGSLIQTYSENRMSIVESRWAYVALHTRPGSACVLVVGSRGYVVAAHAGVRKLCSL